MDYDLWLRLGVSHKLALVPEVLAFYRHKVEGQITSRQWVQAINTRQVKVDFIAQYPELVNHLGPLKLKDLTDGALLHRGYQAYWRRDLVTAWHVFRKVLSLGSWSRKDLKYLIPSLLPQSHFVRLVEMLDKK